MTLQATVVPNLTPLSPFFHLLSAQVPSQDAPVLNNQLELQAAAERHHLVSRIDDLCDCV